MIFKDFILSLIVAAIGVYLLLPKFGFSFSLGNNIEPILYGFLVLAGGYIAFTSISAVEE